MTATLVLVGLAAPLPAAPASPSGDPGANSKTAVTDGPATEGSPGAAAQQSTPPRGGEAAQAPTRQLALPRSSALPAQPGNGAATFLSIERRTLGNGLRVVVNPDHSSPTVAVCVTYSAGSASDAQGREGVSHLLEHLMLRSNPVGSNEDPLRWVTTRGGRIDGFTTADKTSLFTTLPRGNLDFALWLEASRMAHLPSTEKSLEDQKRLAIHEYHLRMSGTPYAQASASLHALVFRDYPAYARSSLGSLDALRQVTLEWVRQAYASGYGPEQAALAIAGDVEAPATFDKVQQYFGGLPQRPPASPATAALPAQEDGPRRRVLQDPTSAAQGLLWGWAIGPSRSEEHYALQVAATLLARGETSRLHQSLVRQRSWAQDVAAWTNGHRGPDLFTIQIMLSDVGRLDAVRAALQEELQALARGGPTATEVARAQQLLRTHWLSGLESNEARAIQLSTYESLWGDARQLGEEADRYAAVTPERVRGAVARYLTTARLSEVVVEPVAAASPISLSQR